MTGTRAAFRGLASNRQGDVFLITNRHVVARTELGDRTDRRHTPSALRVERAVVGCRRERVDSGRVRRFPWAARTGSPRGSSTQHGRRVDVVAVPLFRLPMSRCRRVTSWTSLLPRRRCSCAAEHRQRVFVIGFPVGARPLRDGASPIWTRGSIAGRPRLDWHGRPCFLIDSRTRQGQSGSPAVFYADATMSFVERDGRLAQGPAWGLVRVYGGRIHRDSDIGIVWSAVLWRIWSSAVSGPGCHPWRFSRSSLKTRLGSMRVDLAKACSRSRRAHNPVVAPRRRYDLVWAPAGHLSPIRSNRAEDSCAGL